MIKFRTCLQSFFSITLIWLPQVSAVKLNNNLVLSVEPEIISQRGFAFKGQLTLDLSNRQLSDIENIATLLVHLIKEKRYEEITQIKNLRLVLENNQLYYLPPELKKLQLHELDLSNNKLEDIPEWLLKMPNLKYLYLGGNKKLQKPIDHPKTLKILYNKYNS